MPRKLLKRFMPDHKKMRNHPFLQRFGKRLTDSCLWHLNRRTVALGFALGLFAAFIPSLGQIFIALGFAVLFRANIPAAFVGVWLSNPFTFAPMFFTAYQVGAWLLQVPVSTVTFEISWTWLNTEFLRIWQPFLLGCFICGLAAATTGFLLVRIGWRIMVKRSWSMRRAARRNRR